MGGGGAVLIVGASVRAAAFSALRAGLRPWAVDLFADRDLCAVCPAMRLPGTYPEGFAQFVEGDLPGPWLYTGGLENYPSLVGHWSVRRRLWGNGERELVMMRHPGLMAACLKRAGLPFLAIHWPVSPQPDGIRWLVKPIRSAGGTGIRFLEPRETEDPQATNWYLQEYAEGEPVAALFVGAGAQPPRLLGLTRQLIGADWLRAEPFHYCGSVGPLCLDDGLRRRLEAVGQALAISGGLLGLFGVDGILRGDAFLPVEVNPRYPASTEVLEYATGVAALDWHRRACVRDGTLERQSEPPAAAALVGKAILFARVTVTVPEGPWTEAARRPDPMRLPDYADVPATGERIEAGRPVMTLFARAATPEAVVAELRYRAAETERLIYDTTGQIRN